MSTHSTPFLTLLTSLIRLYQRTLSPDHGMLRWVFPAGVCRFEPTCSEYMAQAIAEEGWRGVAAGLRRLGHCHPYGGTL